MIKNLWSKLCGAGFSGQLMRSGIGSIVIKIANSAAVFVVSVVLARSLGPEKFGIYSYALAIVMLLTVLVMAGFPEMLIREISAYKMDGKRAHIKGVIDFGDRVVLMMTGFVFAVSLIIFITYRADFQQEELYTYGLAVLLIPTLAFASLRSGAIRGYGHVVIGQLPVMLLRPAVFLFFLLSALFFDYALSPQVAMALHLAAGILAFVFGIYYFRKLLYSSEIIEINREDAKKWIKDVLPFTMLAGVMVIDSNVDIIMLGWLTENEDVGIYRAASQTVIIVAFVLSSLNMVVAPYITRLFRSGDMEGLQKMVMIGGRLIAITGVPVAVLLILWGDVFLTVVFGERFAVAAMSLSVLCAGQIVNSLMGINGTVLNMTRYASESAWIVASGALLNVILNLWLIPIYGIVGAALATASSLAFWNILLSWRVYHHLGIRTTAF